ncbi:hypothetical protein Q4I30_006036 [Leishmania utingensis]|uniref:Amastin-like protein n=1 Tax=Leishmania utingensis TaxID=653362 RepID=A0AAW3A8A4_9TRYP
MGHYTVVVLTSIELLLVAQRSQCLLRAVVGALYVMLGGALLWLFGFVEVGITCGGKVGRWYRRTGEGVDSPLYVCGGVSDFTVEWQ